MSYELSVIIPVYNAENWLLKCFESLKKQKNFKDIEIIFIDDGSIDNSFAICSDLAIKFLNVKFIDSKDNHGVAYVRNLGLKVATGKYISFLDSDDYVDVDFYDDALKYLNKYNVDIICYGMYYEYKDSTVIRKPKTSYFCSSYEFLSDLYLKNSIDQTITNKVFSKRVLKNIFFNEDIHIAEDYLFLIQILLNYNPNIYVRDKAVYHYLMNDNSAMRKKFNKKRFESIYVSELVTKLVSNKYPKLKPYLISSEIDNVCRVICDIVYSNEINNYSEEFYLLKKRVKDYKLIDKFKFSNKKHFFAFVLTRISPKLYNFIKEDLKFQYK